MPDQNKPTDEDSSEKKIASSGINPPDIDPKSRTLKPRRRAIRDGKQAFSIAEGVFSDTNDRNIKNGVIAEKYDGGQPFNSRALQAANEGWRHNFPTGFLSGIVDRVVPVPVQYIDGARFLTAARLKRNEPDAVDKSKEACQRFTKLVRSWVGWNAFKYALCQEDVLYGYAIAAILDGYEWRPQFFRQDEFGVPEGTGQHSDMAQFLVFKKNFLIHELVDKISGGVFSEAAENDEDEGPSDEEIEAGRKAADDEGWDIEATIEALNKAAPKVIGEDNKETPSTRGYQDMVREGNSGMSHEKGATQVSTYIVLAREATGKVSRYIINRGEKQKVLFMREDEVAKMSDTATFFTLQPGNSKFYGSKGLGRTLVNIHMALDRTRNRAFDQLYLSSLLWLSTEGGVPAVQFKVKHPFGIFGSEAKVEAQGLPVNVQDYLNLDSKLTSIAEIAAGAYIPTALNDDGRTNKTATEAGIDKVREDQARVAYIQRLSGQFAELVSMMQRRACDPDTGDAQAKEFQRELKEDVGMTEEEIQEWARCPSSEVGSEISQGDAMNQGIVAMAQRFSGDPNFDQIALKRMEATALTNPAIADAVMLEDEIDPTLENEQVWKQLVENTIMQSGGSLPVSPRDIDEIHLKVLMGELDNSVPGIVANPHPKILDNVNAALRHGEAHVDAMESKGKDPEAIKTLRAYFDEGEEKLGELGQYIADRAAQGLSTHPSEDAMGGAPQLPGPTNNPVTDPAVSPAGPETGGPVAGGLAEPPKAGDLVRIYNDAPPDIRRQIEAKLGFIPSGIGEAEVTEEGSEKSTAPLPPPPPSPDPNGIMSSPPEVPISAPPPENIPAEMTLPTEPVPVGSLPPDGSTEA